MRIGQSKILIAKPGQLAANLCQLGRIACLDGQGRECLDERQKLCRAMPIVTS